MKLNIDSEWLERKAKLEGRTPFTGIGPSKELLASIGEAPKPNSMLGLLKVVIARLFRRERDRL